MWLGVFGVTTNALLTRALNVRSDGFPRLLAREGLVAEHRVKGYAPVLYTLTSAGCSVAGMLLARRVVGVRGDKVTTSQLAHDLMTQSSVLHILRSMADQSGMHLDLRDFLTHARAARDLGQFDPRVRPDALFVKDGAALSWECENYGKSSQAIKSKMRLLYSTAAQFTRLTVFWTIRGGPAVVDRYRTCFEQVQDDIERDGLSPECASRLKCHFSHAESIRGMR
jgi:hypothetical protein